MNEDDVIEKRRPPITTLRHRIIQYQVLAAGICVKQVVCLFF